jgi:hypothetical protein
MRRPGIVLETYRSFAANLRGVDFAASTLYLNIDPKPIEGDAGAVILAARQFFGNVVVNQPEHACFPAAVKWCWAQPGGEYFFGLEDDWRLERPVEIADMLAPLRADPGLSCVNIQRLSAQRRSPLSRAGPLANRSREGDRREDADRREP